MGVYEDIDVFADEVRAWYQTYAPDLADLCAETEAEMLRQFYADSCDNADAIEEFDAVLRIVQRKCHVKEKLEVLGRPPFFPLASQS